LNGAHSLIAYLGQNRGLAYVRDVMAVPEYRAAVQALMREAVETLDPVPGIDLDAYMDSLLKRFTNRAIAHATKQIAMDGTQKLPKRLLEPAVDARRADKSANSFARAIAEWIHYCCSQSTIDDPREDELLAAAGESRRRVKGQAEPFLALPGLFSEALRRDREWCASIEDTLMKLRTSN
jgi:fructuronate reductase